MVHWFKVTPSGRRTCRGQCIHNKTGGLLEAEGLDAEGADLILEKLMAPQQV